MRISRARSARVILLIVVGVVLLGSTVQASYTNCVLQPGYPVIGAGAHCGYCLYYWGNPTYPDLSLQLTTYHYHCTEGELTETTERHDTCYYIRECH